MKKDIIFLLIILIILIPVLNLKVFSTENINTGSEKGNCCGEDCIFVYNNKMFPLKTEVTGLLKELGEDYNVYCAPSCVYQGEDKEFEYIGITIFTFPQTEEKDIIDEILITDKNYQTAKGITVGSSLKEIEKNYGKKYVKEENFVTYSVNYKDDTSSRLIFVLNQDNLVEMISFYSPSNM